MKLSCALLLVVFASSSWAIPNGNFMQRMARHSKVRPPQFGRSTYADYVPGLPGGFKCTVLAASPTIPTNARNVRPADIKVVGALGDSLTAGNGVLSTSVPEVLKQFRGLSWSAGGDQDITKVLTVPNILKKYNTKLYGYSLGSSYSEDTPDAYYNVASAGDTAVELVDQSRKLVSKITADNRHKEWKLITVFIGGNDVCEYCNNKNLYSPDNYKANIRTSLDNLYNGFTNTIINLAGPIDMTEVTKLPDSLACSAAHRSVCGCLYNKSDPDYAARVSRQYQQKVEEIVAEAPSRWPRADFGVAYQPQYTRIVLPIVNGQPDLSYFAPDCFHFSQKGQEHAAITLWNNMLKPVAQRATTMQLEDRSMTCPTTDKPYIMI